MPRSMTGYARFQADTPAFTLAVSVKSVNHRFLDVQARLPAELEAFESAARRLIRQRIVRGHVQLSATLERRGPASVRIERHLAEGYLEAYRRLAEEQGLPNEPDLNAVLRFPGILVWGTAGTGADLEAMLLETLGKAVTELDRVRQREAAAIVEEMQRRSGVIDEALDRMAAVREGLTPRLAERLGQRIAELLGASAPDPQRVLQEAALLAERSEIAEEIERLREHNRQLRALLAEPGEVGKRLDFLMQEMSREANTIVSKSAGIGSAGLAITDLGLALKAEIEKIREQASNLE